MFLGFWIGFLNIENLSSKLVSSLSSLLTQLNERKETIAINNEKCNLFSKSNYQFAYFATSKSAARDLNDSSIDSMKITKIEHHFNSISKDLLEKFRVVRLETLNRKALIESSLITNGFTTSHSLADQIAQIVHMFTNILHQTRNGFYSYNNFSNRNNKFKFH